MLCLCYFSLLHLAAAKVIDINAGNAQGADIFSPASVTADVGDVLRFHFYPRTHNVVKGIFDTPCQPANDGFFSGNFKGGEDGKENGTTFSVVVDNTEPIWYFCEVGNHCSNGMVGVVNPPPDGPTVEDWKRLSAGATAGEVNVSPGSGGQISNSGAPPDFDPLHPQENDDQASDEGMASIVSSTVTAITTDASGNPFTTSYATANTITEASNSTMRPTKTGGVESLVPSWDAAPVARERMPDLIAIALGMAAMI